MENIKNTDEKKEKSKKIIILLLILLLIAAGVIGYLLTREEPKTAVIENINTEYTDPDEGQIRVKLNPYINISSNTMQDLEFYNLNENRLMTCKITVDDKVVYDSDYISTGEVIKADVIDTDDLEKGENEALAEISSYTLDKEKQGTSQVKVTLNVK